MKLFEVRQRCYRLTMGAVYLWMAVATGVLLFGATWGIFVETAEGTGACWSALVMALFCAGIAAATEDRIGRHADLRLAYDGLCIENEVLTDALECALKYTERGRDFDDAELEPIRQILAAVRGSYGETEEI